MYYVMLALLKEKQQIGATRINDPAMRKVRRIRVLRFSTETQK